MDWEFGKENPDKKGDKKNMFIGKLEKYISNNISVTCQHLKKTDLL